MCQFLCFLVGISYWTNCKPTSCWFSSSSPLGSLFSRWKLRSLFSLKHHRQDVAIIQTSPERPGKGGSNCWCPGGRECDPNFNRSPLEICGFYNLFWGCISLINIYLNLDTVYVFIFRCSICIYIYLCHVSSNLFVVEKLLFFWETFHHAVIHLFCFFGKNPFKMALRPKTWNKTKKLL